MKDKFRSFLAIDFTDAFRDELTHFQEQLRLKPELHSLKWAKSENLHITMRFLGNITLQQYNEITASLCDSINTIEPFELSLTDLMIFPNTNKPVALALKPEPLTPLLQLSQLIEQAVVKHGVKPEPRTFLPHLTLAKIKHRGDLELPQIKTPKFQTAVKGIACFRSDADQDGSQYTPLVCIRF